ncbi:hypothetical protein [Sphingosinicella sp.]|uniref:hypothetical protein n=1 Tax=Sphingosinicella sp. TaxID=1917971 RepID=UPI00403822BC
MNHLPLDPDPEIAALLGFSPVLRKCKRHDGWTPDRQRGFIAALARLGEVDRAAQSLGRTGSGAFKVRTSAGGEGFADAWDCALTLFHARNPGLSRRGGRARPPWIPPEPDPDEDEPFELAIDDVLKGLLDRYRKKLQQERECRLAGRIVEADYYVRQLSFIELALDLGVSADALHDLFRSGEVDLFDTIGTPMSLLLDRLRRDYWREKGEPDRIPPALLGEHDEQRATAALPGHYRADRDGPYNEWLARRAALEALQAEAQRLWESQAKADAEAWAERVRRAIEEGPGSATIEDAKG